MELRKVTNNKVILMWNGWTEASIYPCHVSSNDPYAMMYYIFWQFVVVKYILVIYTVIYLVNWSTEPLFTIHI